jgi:uncharacterized protein
MKEIKLDLRQIFEKEKQPYFKAEYEIKPEDLGVPADVGDLKEPVKVDVYIVRNPQGEGYKVMYNIRGGIDLTCSRCLETFTKDLAGEHTVVAQNGFNEREHLSESDMNVYPLENSVLNLTELVREQIILDVPYKPLCHPECGGIHYRTETAEEEKPAEGGNNPFNQLKDLLKK